MKLIGRLKLIAAINAVIILTLAFGMTITGCGMGGTTSRAVEVKHSPSLRDIEAMAGPDSKSSGTSSFAANDISISLTVGAKGLIKSGEWFPVYVTIENSGKPVKGHVAISPSFSGSRNWVYRQNIDLGHGSKKLLLFNVHSNFEGNVPIKAAFISNGKPLVETIVRYNALPPGQQIILVLTDDDSNRQFFKDIVAEHPNISIAYMDPKELPYRDSSLSQISAIIISGVSTRPLSKDQKSALSNWLASGGRLFVCGGPGWKKTISGLPKEMLPVEPSETAIVGSLPAIEVFAGVDSSIHGLITSTSIPVATASKINGKIFAGDTNDPLIVSKSVGFGEVTWIALDLTIEPFTSWRSNAPFWNRLNQIQPMARKSSTSPNFESFNGLRNSISSIPALKLPELDWLIPYIVIYIIIIGPFNYFILRRKDKKELAWITIPVIILVFSLGTFTYAYSKKGGSIIINQVSIIEHFPGTEIAKITSSFGIFSPAKRNYDVLLPQGSSVDELGAVGPVAPGNPTGRVFTVEDGLRPRIKDMAVGMWAMRGAYTERITKMEPSLTGTVKFTKAGASIRLNNKGKNDFTNAIVVANNYIWRIGKLSALKELKANVEFSNAIKFDPVVNPIGHQIYESDISFDSRTGKNGQNNFVMAEIANSAFGYQGEKTPRSPVVMAWFHKPVETIEILNEKPRISGLTAVIVPLRIE